MNLGRNTVTNINIGVVVTNTSGVPVAADAAPVAYFYRADASGILALDLMVGTNGTITMSTLSGQTGVYSCPVLVSSMEHTQYQVLIRYAVASAQRTQIQSILFNDAYDVITRDATSPIASVTLSTVSV